MSDESDVELHIARKEMPKKRLIKAQIPKSPTEDTLEKEPKVTKLTTGNMVEQALAFLDTRKGVSLYAIKRYMEANHKIDTEKNNHLIKRFIKTAVEKGTVIKTKGIGARGSFRLAPKKTVKQKKPTEKKEKITKKPTGTVMEKTKKLSEKNQNEIKSTKTKGTKTEKPPKKATKTKEKRLEKEITKTKQTKATKKEEVTKEKIPDASKKKKVDIKLPMTPALKKKILTKRKSIGSIIKPPKMKPKSMKSTKTK